MLPFFSLDEDIANAAQKIEIFPVDILKGSA